MAYLPEQPFSFVDLFCGPGGLSVGFTWAGFVPLLAVDKVKDCTDTYAANHPSTIVMTEDFRELSEDKIKRLLRQRCGATSVDVVVGGPPCESFSTAGPAIRKAGDVRDTLFEHIIRIAKALRARYLLIENIPGLVSKASRAGVKGGVFTGLLHRLIEHGFTRYDYRVLDAADYGVPQFRRRLFVLATSDKCLPVVFPEPSHAAPSEAARRGLWQWVTVDDAIGDLPSLCSRQRDSERASGYTKEPENDFQRLMHGQSTSEFPVPPAYLVPHGLIPSELTYHWAPNHRPATIERLRMIRQGEGLRDLWMRLDPKEREDLQRSRVLPARWYIQRFRRLVPGEPSVTVTSHCLDELAHPSDDRLVTVREAARLQSFADSYQFPGGKWINPHGFEPQDKYEQIGDAVPPLLAWNLARCLRAGLQVLDPEQTHPRRRNSAKRA